MENIYQSFFEKLLKPLKEYYDGGTKVENVRKSLLTINRFFYNTYPEIGTVHVNELDFGGPYFSEFHKIWHVKSEEIISPSIDEVKCQVAAKVLHNVRTKFGDTPFSQKIDFKGLSVQDIATVRFLTANQEFRGSRGTEGYFQQFKDNPIIFDLKSISDNPATFLSNINVSKLSQNDKREKFAKYSADFLINKGITAFDIAQYYGQDTLEIKNSITSNVGMGYGNKKVDMFLRDMHDWVFGLICKNYHS